MQVGSGQKGRQVTAVVAMDANTGTAPPVTRSAPKASSGRTRTDTASAVEVEGIVKWFNAAKGFGFVACEDGEKDVFVHISIVERAGLSTLHEAQRVSMKVVGTLLQPLRLFAHRSSPELPPLSGSRIHRPL